MSEQATAISITHTSGHREGLIQFFPVGMNEIPFMRCGNSEYSVSVDMKDVEISRDGHGSVDVRKHGRSEAYWFVPRAGYSAEINGLKIAETTPLKNGDIIKLGGANGVSFSVELHETSLRDVNEIEKTIVQSQSLTMREQFKFYRQRVLITISLLIICFVGYVYFFESSLDKRLRAVVEENRIDAATTSERSFVPAVIEKLEAATYLIAVEGPDETRGIATAWAYDKYTLVSNAHVAKEFAARSAGETLVAIQSVTGKKWTIKNPPKFHPGYERFKEFIDANPRGVQSSSGGFQSVSFIEGYDLAFFKISAEEPLPITLDLATEDKLGNIDIGINLAYAGFALDTTVFAKQVHLAPKPNIQFGNVTGTSNYFGLPSIDRESNFLIHHNLPAEGGTSGSPIVNSEGKVVAVLSAGNILKIGGGQGTEKRIANPVQINFGQRADLVLSIHEDDNYVRENLSEWESANSYFEERETILKDYLGIKGKKLFKKEISHLKNRSKLMIKREKNYSTVSIFEFVMETNDFDGTALLISSKDKSGISVVFEQDGKRKKPYKMETQNDYVMAWFSQMSEGNLAILVQSQNENLDNVQLYTGFF